MNDTTDDLQYEKITYSVKETGAAIRKALRAAFPGVKFSLRGSRGTGFGWFSLSWTDGPTTWQVDEITNGFLSSYFDGMDDSTHRIPATMAVEPDGVIREHRWSCRGVNSSRDYSEAATAWGVALIDTHGGPAVFSPDYSRATAADGVWRLFQRIDLQGIDWEALPSPAGPFTGRHVPDSYCLETGGPYGYELDETPRHRAA